ncbi:hypothetical protein ENBRE01_0071 [Enteropsectra breve]|nr:hypothetical protein ENBRE01_0071 [Enteropsectra breve]
MRIAFMLPLAIIAKNITIITRDGCPYSEKMRDLLRSKKLKYTDLNNSKLAYDAREEYEVPEVTYPAVFIGEEYVGGYVDAKKII